MAEIYVSTDVETDGPVPDLYSMLSVGSAAFTPDGEMVGTFYRNLHPLTTADRHPRTMEFWAAHPEAWAALQVDRVFAAEAMLDYADWLKGLPGKPVFVGHPASWDFAFVFYYLMRFIGESPFGFSALDIKTLAWAKLGGDFRNVGKRLIHRAVGKPETKHDHTALNDAIEQGQTFLRLMKHGGGG